MTDLRGKVAYALAVSGGAGLVPSWPGTAGAVIGVPLAAILVSGPWWFVVAGCAALFAVGVWASSWMCREAGMDDPQLVVIDETFGCAVTLCCLPVDPLWWAAGFIAFRALDIVKPWPIQLVEDKVKGGLGVMLDDAAAAAMAVLGLQLLLQAIALIL